MVIRVMLYPSSHPLLKPQLRKCFRVDSLGDVLIFKLGFFFNYYTDFLLRIFTATTYVSIQIGE